MTLRLSPTQVARLRGAIPHVDLDSARFLGAGWHVLAYRAGSWTIRIPRVERGRELIDRQTRLYRVLSANGLPVPRDARVARGDAGAVVAGLYRYIAGEPAAPRSLGATLARELGAFLTSLHTLSTDRLRSICGVEADPWGGHYEPAFLRCRPFLPPELREWLDASVAAYLEARAGLDPGCLVLVHADLSGEHVLVDGEGHLRGVIDFKPPRLADPAVDFAALDERLGAPFAEAVLDAYAGPVDAAFLRRVRFYADMRPLVPVASGIRHHQPDRLRDGFARLERRYQLARGRS